MSSLALNFPVGLQTLWLLVTESHVGQSHVHRIWELFGDSAIGLHSHSQESLVHHQLRAIPGDIPDCLHGRGSPGEVARAFHVIHAYLQPQDCFPDQQGGAWAMLSLGELPGSVGGQRDLPFL